MHAFQHTHIPTYIELNHAHKFEYMGQKSIRDLGEREESQEFKSSLSSRERRARRKADKQSKS